jgi:hypothetical protein
MANGVGSPVANPTYMADIRHFFEDLDIDHMRGYGIDLATYEGVKFNALRTYFRTKEGTMPPETDRRWSEARIETFYNWMRNDFPRGVVAPEPGIPPGTPAARVRRNLADFQPDDVEKLRLAFNGMMGRDPDHPQSYFTLAGIHWLPGPEFYCRHHENAYNPWHRAYLMVFEDALRSVEGCEDVTLPYWDITASEIPPVLFEEPFDTYTIPQELCTLNGFCYPQGHVTQRYAPQLILDNIANYDIPQTITDALGHSHWERFNGWDAGRTQDGIIRAHDAGHGAGGLTLANQDIAAFDPLFWFFHANWDRLWWKWQQDFSATTLNAFKTHIDGATDWLDNPVLNKLPPFAQTTAETIDLSVFDVGYEHPTVEAPSALSATRFGSLRAAHAFAVEASQKVSIRIKDVHRLEIPGSFDVILRVDGKVIGKQAFFQATEPKHCETCRHNELASFDFIVKQSELARGKVQVNIEYRQPDGATRPFPLSACGNPSVNIRLLLEE